MGRAFSQQSMPSGVTKAAMMGEKLKTDGGEAETWLNGDPYCDAAKGGDLPCFDCFEGKEA